jgi:hypothetical protein
MVTGVIVQRDTRATKIASIGNDPGEKPLGTSAMLDFEAGTLFREHN